MKNTPFLFIFLSVFFTYGQKDKVCETPEEDILDLNSITKCAVKSSKNSKNKGIRQLSVKILAPKRRFLKKRDVQTQAGSDINAEGVANTKTDKFVLKKLELKTNIANITDRLSKEEIRKADKFSSVENLPLFINCKTVSNKEQQMDCFNTEMIKHIQEHFVYPNEAFINKIQGNVWVRFIIDKNGNISNMKTLGPKNGKILNDEAMRVVSLLPKFIPATKNGKNVPVKYGLPIAFSLNDN